MIICWKQGLGPRSNEGETILSIIVVVAPDHIAAEETGVTHGSPKGVAYLCIPSCIHMNMSNVMKLSPQTWPHCFRNAWSQRGQML